MSALGRSTLFKTGKISRFASNAKYTFAKVWMEAVNYIYKQLRNSEPPDEATARDVIDKLFFSEKRYDLGDVGRYRLNKKQNGTAAESAEFREKFTDKICCRC